MTHYDRVVLAETEYPKEDAINDWLESQACADWIDDSVTALVAGKDVIWSKSGRRNIGIFAYQLHDMIQEEQPAEWTAFCRANLIDRQLCTDDSKQTKDLAWSNLAGVMRAYAHRIVYDNVREYVEHKIEQDKRNAEECEL